MTQNEEKKIRYSFIPVPKEIYKELKGDELKLFLHLMDECKKYEKQHKTYHPNQKKLSEVLGWGLNCTKLKRNINSLLKKELIEVNVGTYLTSDPTASEYHINWKTVNNHRHQKGDGDDMSNDNHRHQNSDATKNIILLSTIYTMEFLKNRCPNGLIPDVVTSDMFNELINIISNKIKNISSEVTPGTGTFQDEKVNNFLKLINNKKENEMSNKVAIEMNAISEQSERQARENESSESGTKNAMTTSTSGDKNNTSKEFQNIPVDKSKVENEENDTPKGLIPIPPNSAQPPFPLNKATGEPKNVSDDKLSTKRNKTCQNARKEEIRRFNERHDKNRWDMCHNIKSSADFDRVNAKLQEDIDYVNRCDWSEDRKELWHSNYDLWRSKCGPIVMKHLNKVKEMEEAS